MCIRDRSSAAVLESTMSARRTGSDAVNSWSRFAAAAAKVLKIARITYPCLLYTSATPSRGSFWSLRRSSCRLIALFAFVGNRQVHVTNSPFQNFLRRGGRRKRCKGQTPPCRRTARSADSPRLRRRGNPKRGEPVSYTHLDVYKRQILCG